MIPQLNTQDFEGYALDFNGTDPSKSVPDTIPQFKEVRVPIAAHEDPATLRAAMTPVHYDDMEWTFQAQSVKYLKAYWSGSRAYRSYPGKRKK